MGNVAYLSYFIDNHYYLWYIIVVIQMILPIICVTLFAIYPKLGEKVDNYFENKKIIRISSIILISTLTLFKSFYLMSSSKNISDIQLYNKYNVNYPPLIEVGAC